MHNKWFPLSVASPVSIINYKARLTQFYFSLDWARLFQVSSFSLSLSMRCLHQMGMEINLITQSCCIDPFNERKLTLYFELIFRFTEVILGAVIVTYCSGHGPAVLEGSRPKFCM